jgi:hypothetical protein
MNTNINNQLFEQIARHRRAMQAAAGLLNKTGLCSPADAAEIGRILGDVANATGEAATEQAVRVLEERAGY